MSLVSCERSPAVFICRDRVCAFRVSAFHGISAGWALPFLLEQAGGGPSRVRETGR